MKNLILFMLVFVFLTPNAALSQNNPNSPSNRSITDFLNEDGTFSNPDGYSGTVDVSGYEMVSNSDGTPTFLSVDDDLWNLQSYYPGTNNEVYVMVVNGDDLYIGGIFTNAGGVPASRIARFNLTDRSWHALGSGVNGAVRALVIVGDYLYVGGSFSTAGGVSGRNNIARYDLTANDDTGWLGIGGGLNNQVFTFAVSGDDLYMAGNFTTANGVVGYNQIARYNINYGTWYKLGLGLNGNARKLLIDGTDLYVGGQFSEAGGAPASKIARYDIASDAGFGNGDWYPLGSGLNNNVLALAKNGDYLYVGGRFTEAGGIPANRIARYDLTTDDGSGNGTWSSLGDGISYTIAGTPIVHAITVVGTDLFVGGEFNQAGNTTAVRSARYDLSTDNGNASWYALVNRSASSTVYDLIALNGTDLVVAGGGRNNYIDIYDVNAQPGDFAWKYLGDGFSYNVTALAINGDDLYLGGGFTGLTNGIQVNRIVRYNMSDKTWQSLGSGVNGAVWALAIKGQYLYVGGDFTHAGGVGGKGSIARYDMTVNDSNAGWSGLGSGLGGGIARPVVRSLVFYEDELIVGGIFDEAGGTPGRVGVARYNTLVGDDDSGWSGLGSGVDALPIVYSLAINGTDLYVGGRFSKAGGVSGRNGIARYD